MLKVVLDPGVLVAAAIAPRGVCGSLLRSPLAERYQFVVCPMLLKELRDVLLRPKFRRYLTEEQVEHYVVLITEVAERHPDPTVQPGLTPDPDDDYLIALAQTVGTNFLISGDAHLTGLRTEPPVLSPRDFLQTLE